MRVFIYTLIALLAFAGNSVLCKLALGDDAIDPASFTVLRLLSGLIVLSVLLRIVRFNTDMTPETVSAMEAVESTVNVSAKGSWKASFLLFVYATTFSFAYLFLDTATGALILFAAVQITMIAVSLISGVRLNRFECLGLLISFSGFVYLVFPELSSPSVLGFVLMAVSGVAWGFYTLAGRNSASPLADTSYNFIRTLPFVLILATLALPYASLSWGGVFFAVLSGGVTSGLGYAIWYKALVSLSAVQAGVVQLLVPLFAALGGLVFSGEELTTHLLLSSSIILGGILLLLLGKHYFVPRIAIKSA